MSAIIGRDKEVDELKQLVQSRRAEFVAIYSRRRVGELKAGMCDHLGSASWITEGGGKPMQYMHYLPYGQLLANHLS